MYTILRTTEFDTWLLSLRDEKAKARIAVRIRSAEFGNLGDIQPTGEGISEMRIHYGPGYRVYFKKQGNHQIVLLIGGNKSTQSRDIKKAKAIAATLRV